MWIQVSKSWLWSVCLLGVRALLEALSVGALVGDGEDEEAEQVEVLSEVGITCRFFVMLIWWMLK
ncbi:hypothetical protein RHMOL_Rhmol12G0006900 [Rhododendron molle]|uniref:Uncharacterized protein n=1 Tax=Rhododendron molle TaxID=49168 RepID=A0ACC0LD11_RHOML|nr:hypothetical protein RHMOL_Rhmol12G0006900 [Rhododendron molle]